MFFQLQSPTHTPNISQPTAIPEFAEAANHFQNQLQERNFSHTPVPMPQEPAVPDISSIMSSVNQSDVNFGLEMPNIPANEVSKILSSAEDPNQTHPHIEMENMGYDQVNKIFKKFFTLNFFYDFVTLYSFIHDVI